MDVGVFPLVDGFLDLLLLFGSSFDLLKIRIAVVLGKGQGYEVGGRAARWHHYGFVVCDH